MFVEFGELAHGRGRSLLGGNQRAGLRRGPPRQLKVQLRCRAPVAPRRAITSPCADAVALSDQASLVVCVNADPLSLVRDDDQMTPARILRCVDGAPGADRDHGLTSGSLDVDSVADLVASPAKVLITRPPEKGATKPPSGA